MRSASTVAKRSSTARSSRPLSTAHGRDSPSCAALASSLVRSFANSRTTARLSRTILCYNSATHDGPSFPACGQRHRRCCCNHGFPLSCVPIANPRRENERL
ncbi:Catabolite control protein A [Sesbania bispinosa]|nr:Catabolite control protein A [Sesbania bispinosa]